MQIPKRPDHPDLARYRDDEPLMDKLYRAAKLSNSSTARNELARIRDIQTNKLNIPKAESYKHLELHLRWGPLDG